jgi:hypothetical protein
MRHGGQMANLSVGEFKDKIEAKRNSLTDDMLAATHYSAEQQGLIDLLEGFKTVEDALKTEGLESARVTARLLGYLTL